jgi:hypothetical protein
MWGRRMLFVWMGRLGVVEGFIVGSFEEKDS